MRNNIVRETLKQQKQAVGAAAYASRSRNKKMEDQTAKIENMPSSTKTIVNETRSNELRMANNNFRIESQNLIP